MIISAPFRNVAWLASGVVVALWLFVGVSEAQEADGVAEEDALIPEFAPGAQGEIKPSIPQMLNDAEALARAWEDSLDIQTADDFGTDLGVDLDAIRQRALNHPRVRALLNAEEGQGTADPADQPRYAQNQVFLFASFSIPEPSLRAMMHEANALGVPILFNGFVNNSVFETRERLLDVFGSDEDIIGFSIDPTMFVRFGVEAVPAVVITAESVEPCYTTGCVGDEPPPHDIIKGNIPLIAALDISARAGGDGSVVAREMRTLWEGQR